MTTNQPSRRRSSAESVDWITAKSRIAPYSQACHAGAVLDFEPLGGAAAGLELRPDAGQAHPQQRRGGRTGRSCGQFGQAEIGDRSAPSIGRPGQDDQICFPAEQAALEEILRGAGDFRRSAIRVGRVQAAEPHGPAVAEHNVEPLIDANRLNPPARQAASGKAGRPPKSMPASAAQAT